MIIYHGSNVIIKKPHIFTSGFYKDFGYGFYCTKIEKQAVKWSLTKFPKHIVNSYEYLENMDLNIFQFDVMNEEWLDFIASCRNGKAHSWDIVEGPMADDTVWDYVEDFMEGRISRNAFWELVKFKYPTHQIVFCNDTALQCISFKDSKAVPYIE